MRNPILVSIILLLASTGLTAQSIITDRPDLTESASTVSPLTLQIETGTLFEVEDRLKTWTLNTTLFRYGIIKNLEFRLVTELVQHKDRVNFAKTGMNDMQLGLKYRLIDGPVQVSYLGHAFVPTGSREFSAGGPGISNKIAVDGDLSDRVSTGVNLGVDFFQDAAPSYSYTWAVGIGLTDRFGYFAELFGYFENFDSIDQFFDMGFTYLINDDLQLDFSVGSDFTRARDYNFWSAGVSWRIEN